MRLVIDTNVILDVLMERMPFYPLSKKVLTLCDKGKVKGFVSASTVTDIFYLTRKALGNTEVAYKAIGDLLLIVKVLPVTGDDVTRAFMQKAKDFEDCLLATCAKSNGCDGIVTRNKKDFKDFDIDLMTPDELITLLS